MSLDGNLESATKSWSNLAKVVYKRTYSRNDFGKEENWTDTVSRVISGNTKNHKVDAKEIERLRYFILNRKSMPAGRGLWFSGSPSHERIGGAALNNCWFTTADDWENFVLAQDLLMLGGGVGLSVEHKFVSKLPKIKKEVRISHKATKDADFIVPDSREGWNELTHRVLESFFVTGKSFTYSTICVRGYGEVIKGFGGTASGPAPFIKFIENICSLLSIREGKHVRPIDAADMICSIGEFVVMGNVRRSAIIIIGDSWDKEYLLAKRWDLGTLPSYRAMANFSIVCEDIEDVHPLYWKTYEVGEAFGLVNTKNISTYGRMGEKKWDNAIGLNPCGESSLYTNEPCNLQEQFLPNLNSVEEFVESSRLMHRWGKRVTCEAYHNPKNDAIVKKNRRIGTGITGCLQSSLYKADILDKVYQEIQEENVSYSKELNIPESIRTTLVKPSGTLSLLGDCTPGIHPAYSKYYIRRVRFASNDKIVPILKRANHNVEPVWKLDGTLDHGTLVSDFYCQTPDGTPCADRDFDTWKQLDSLLFAQKHWSDQAVSVTVYYKKEEISLIKAWLKNNLSSLKSISFLCHSDHGFKQAPYEAITEEQYNKVSPSIKNIELDEVGIGEISSLECEGGVCPVK
jgi:ribonucleoside-triphosphate reductase (thioredoxin)